MKKNYNQFAFFDCPESSHKNNQIEELGEINTNISNSWKKKLRSYNQNKYTEDLEKFGIETTWKNICGYVLENEVNEFLNVENFSELYELALAIKNKKLKKDNGQYYTPKDVAEVMSNWLKELAALNICDVACGTGNLILTYLDLIGQNESSKILDEGRLYLYDLDITALRICKTAILVKYGKQYSSKIHAIHCDFLNKKVLLPPNSKVISNPPYAGISSIPYEWDRSKIQMNTKELYSSFMEKILIQSDKSVIITPYSFIGGNKFYTLRLLMNDYAGFIVSFDNVPGNIFYGKKHGIFNTNTSNSVRAAITVVDNKGKGFNLSPLIRFKNEERKTLLRNHILESTLSEKKQIVDKNNKAYIKCPKDLEAINNAWMNKSNQCLKDILSTKPSKYQIFIPNTCRYFTTASSYELKRAGFIKLYFENYVEYCFVYCLINSSFAYWWWRMFDGGITYSKGLLNTLPIFINLLNNEDITFFKTTSENMMRIEKKCIVTKLNAGSIQENLKFPSKYRNQINNRLLKILGFDNLNSQVFDALHKNSFFGSLNKSEK